MGLKIGVIGTGRLGREHVRVLSEMDDVAFVGCHDIDVDRCRSVAEKNGAVAFDALPPLLEQVDAVSVVVPTTAHLDVVMTALETGRDVFVEKPIAHSAEAAERMVRFARDRERVLQVGHVERFNGVLEKVASRIENPEFIEIHRLASFTARGIDVSVVGDLMIHDLDLLFYVLGEWPSEIRAKGAGVLTPAPDIVNARLEYPSGCVANVTASRVSMEPLRKLRVFCPQRYISVDLLRGAAIEAHRGPGFDDGMAVLSRGGDASRDLNLANFIDITRHTSDGTEPLRKELTAFCRAVRDRGEPVVSGEDGLNAVRLAETIVGLIQTRPHD